MPYLGSIRLTLDRRNEAVTTAMKSFNKTGIFRLISESLAQLFDCAVQAVIEVNKRVGRPKPSLQFFPGHHLSRVLQQHDQHL
jgi:hypothetical protein